ncbi:kinesin-like protein NACK1 [Artemisia annua]|uniref:Kinesin-like protein NACK1 n=1 Tax=Artemisia annua TaxID=35608 RepID=A0A2U1L0S2_ARTAN|nr:kinesin-like protein NACK1 [Artemisia annua]
MKTFLVLVDKVFGPATVTESVYEEGMETVACIEIYNENVRDLLNSKFGRNLKLRDDPERGTLVEKYVDETTRDDKPLRNLISISQRQVGEIALNDTSSRSHQIIVNEFTRKHGLFDVLLIPALQNQMKALQLKHMVLDKLRQLEEPSSAKSFVSTFYT